MIWHTAAVLDGGARGGTESSMAKTFVAEAVNRVANAITEPVLGPVRRLLPPMRLGAGAMDLSPILVSFAVIIIMNFL